MLVMTVCDSQGMLGAAVLTPLISIQQHQKECLAIMGQHHEP